MSAFAKMKYVGCAADSVIAAFDSLNDAVSKTDFSEYCVFPGFCDVHVHFREPGFSYKETIKSGSEAAARGGYTHVCTMPNLNPVSDSADHVAQQLALIHKDACIHVYPYGAITVGQLGEKLSDMAALSEFVIAFSDDGRGVQSTALMEAAMVQAKKLNKLIVAHCEVNSLLNGGYIHDGEYAKVHVHRGICSASEYVQIARDLELVKKTGCKYHVCHISAKESVDLIRKAKAEGLDVSCETAPHYLVMDDSMLCEDGKFKMNPPLRSREDREALIEGILDGTIDMIATDHAPHSAEEKSKGLAGSAFGIVGIETAFPVLYTHFVKTGIISIEKLVDLLCWNPRNRFEIVADKCYTVWDLNQSFTVDPADFISKGKATPFEGWNLFGQCIMTICDGRIVYRRNGEGKVNG